LTTSFVVEGSVTHWRARPPSSPGSVVPVRSRAPRPGQLGLSAGGTLLGTNRGGEDHTFTEVAAFGGGCVAPLNAILGLTAVPECSVPGLFDQTLVEQGATFEVTGLAPGVHLFECLIHPWMRTTVTVD